MAIGYLSFLDPQTITTGSSIAALSFNRSDLSNTVSLTQSASNTLTLSSSSILNISNTLASTASNNGALVIAGGIGVGNDSFFNYVTAVGLTVTGNLNVVGNNQLTIGFGSGNSTITLAGASTGLKTIGFYSGTNTNTGKRWLVYSTSDSDTTFVIEARSAIGSLVDQPFTILRAAGGLITLARPTSITDTTDSTTSTSGALVVTGGIGVAGHMFIAQRTTSYVGFDAGSSASQCGVNNFYDGTASGYFLSLGGNYASPSARTWQLLGSSSGGDHNLTIANQGTAGFNLIMSKGNLTLTNGQIIMTAATGIVLTGSGAPGVTTNTLYQISGNLYFNGTQLAAGGGMTNPMTTLGDTIYGAAAGAGTRLAGPTTNGTYVLTEVVTASAAVAPAWTNLATYLASPPAIGGTAAAAGTFTSITLNGSNPQLVQTIAGRLDNKLYNTSAATDTKWWEWSLDGAGGAGTLQLGIRDDAGTYGGFFAEFIRTGNAVTRTLFGATIWVNGNVSAQSSNSHITAGNSGNNESSYINCSGYNSTTAYPSLMIANPINSFALGCDDTSTQTLRLGQASTVGVWSTTSSTLKFKIDSSLASTTSTTGALVVGGGVGVGGSINAAGSITGNNIISAGTGSVPSYANAEILAYDTYAGYMQIAAQNLSNNVAASTDYVATADTGTDSTHYVDLGINSSAYAQGTWTINGALDGYLYSQDTNLAIGTATAAKNLVFFTGGTLAANSRLVISDTAITPGIAISLPASQGITIASGAPSTTTNSLYSNGGSLFFNGSAVGFTRIAIADAAYVIATTASVILAYTSLTAARILTLPAATQAGQIIWIVDSSGSSSTINTITVTRAGTDTIEGVGTTWVINSPYTSLCLESNGAGKWAVLAYEEVPILMGNANLVVTNREDVIVILNTTLTAARTITLPAATVTGQRITFIDATGSITTTNTISFVRAGSDTINNALTTYVITAPYGYVELVANGISKWTCVQEANIDSGASLTTTGAFPLTLTTTALTTATLPTGTVTLAQLGAQSFTGVQTFSATDVHTLGLTLTSSAAVSTNGYLGYDSTRLQLSSYINGMKASIPGVIYAGFGGTADTAATITSLFTGMTGIGTNTLPSGWGITSKVIRVKGSGCYTSSAGTATIIITLTIGSLTFATAAATPVTATAKYWETEWLISFASATTAWVTGKAAFNGTAASNVMGSYASATASGAMTVANPITLSGTWSTTSQSITLQSVVIESLS